MELETDCMRYNTHPDSVVIHGENIIVSDGNSIALMKDKPIIYKDLEES